MIRHAIHYRSAVVLRHTVNVLLLLMMMMRLLMLVTPKDVIS